MDRTELQITELDLPIRTVNMLQEAGIFTVGDLLHRRQAELLGIPNFGRRCLEHVLIALEDIGFQQATGG